MPSLHSEIDSGNLIISFEEDIVSSNVQSSMTAYQKAVEESSSINAVELDLASVTMIDSQGLNLLIGIYQECQKAAWAFKVTNPNDALIKLFKFVKLDGKFGI